MNFIKRKDLSFSLLRIIIGLKSESKSILRQKTSKNILLEMKSKKKIRNKKTLLNQILII